MNATVIVLSAINFVCSINFVINQLNQISLLLKGQRIIIPSNMCSEIKSTIHQGHQGRGKCIVRARNSVFWPGINHEIVELVSQCSECLTHRNRHQKETLLPHDIPKTPWTKVACDLFTIYGKDYLLIVDYHSKYFEVATLGETSRCAKCHKGHKEDIQPPRHTKISFLRQRPTVCCK